jgi:hypothetical protein
MRENCLSGSPTSADSPVGGGVLYKILNYVVKINFSKFF